jgi:hypothetical protein
MTAVVSDAACPGRRAASVAARLSSSAGDGVGGGADGCGGMVWLWRRAEARRCGSDGEMV